VSQSRRRIVIEPDSPATAPTGPCQRWFTRENGRSRRRPGLHR
jgi:hypothetical protein